jgi:ArsR family transcriptional regulator, arsenate/arsenite/antimonite-responsive transcriptional repressor
MDTKTRFTPVPVVTPGTPCCGTPIPARLATDQTTKLADQMKALADPTRIRMLDLLVQQAEPLCVCDITNQFDQHQPTISHHLRILRDAGLVDCEKRGVWAYYWATTMGKQRFALLESLL